MHLRTLVSLLATLPSAALAQLQFPATPQLRSDQRESLVLLGRVWGFVKYHHPRFVVDGANVDSALMAAFPRVMPAPSADAARDSIAAWVDGIGAPRLCGGSCASPPASPALTPEIDWIRDPGVVGRALATQLPRIHAARPLVAKQTYVGYAGARNPEFTNEPNYAPGDLVYAGIRALGVYRLWNILEYWFPYRDLMERDRVAILRDAIGPAWTAERLDDYQRILIRLIARAGDTHANLWSSLNAQPPYGGLTAPVALRMIEGKPVVYAFTNDTLGARSGLRIGDAILAVDGTAVDSLFRSWTPLYAASNEPTRQRDMARNLLRGGDSVVTVTIDRAGVRTIVRASRAPLRLMNTSVAVTHALAGDTFQMLTPEVAYVKLAPLKRDSVARYLELAKDAKVLVIDNRNYPSDFPIYTLGGRLTPVVMPFARFTRADASNPGAFLWDGGETVLQPQAPTFAGKVVVLVNELTQSSAEFHAMAFRTAPGAIVAGSTTAAADGNVSNIPLPGNMRAMITGIGTFYPDRRPTQQIGIIPDLVVRPTLSGFRAGRDEVLEAGVSRALGRTFSVPK